MKCSGCEPPHNGVLIGNEIIRYQEASKEQPYRLLNCIRGEYTTTAKPYKKETPIKRLADHGYKSFFPGWHTIDISVEKMNGQEPAIIGVVKLRGEVEVIKSGG